MTIPSEILAALITFVLTALLSYGIYYYRSHKGNRVLLSYGWSSSLIYISEKYASDFSITYKNKPVEKLILYEFSLYNDGDIDIDDLSDITIDFYPETNQNFFMDFQAQDTAKMIEIHPFEVYQDADISHYSVRISRPYLNSKKKLKEENITLYVFSNTSIKKIDVRGGGKSWRASYKDSKLKAFASMFVKLAPSIIAIFLVFFLAFLLLFFEFGLFQYIDFGTPSYKMFLVAYSFILLPVVVCYAISHVFDLIKFYKKFISQNAPINAKER